MSTRIFTTEHTLNGRATVKAFTEKTAALAYAGEVVANPDASAVTVWEYVTTEAPRAALAACFERGEWWTSRTPLGVVTQAGRFIRATGRKEGK